MVNAFVSVICSLAHINPDEDPDDDIIMPVGPPPGIDEPVDSDDDIPMPEDPSGAEGEGTYPVQIRQY